MTSGLNSELFDADAFAAELAASSNPLLVFRSALTRIAAIIRERFTNDFPVEQLIYQRTGVVDELVRYAWNYILADCAHLGTLVAVGGYGRGELHPGSDVDMLIVFPDHIDPSIHAPLLDRFFTFLWDIGLNVGHSVRTLSQCVEEADKDITIATNMVESRVVAGDAALFVQLRLATAPEKIWPSARFFSAKLTEQANRHRKFNDAIYNLEPNVKEGPGGLRDIHMIGWVVKRHFGAVTLHELVAHRFLTEQEYETLMHCQAFLWKVRLGLHLLSNRREDRLLFEYQRALAKQFGHRDADHRLAVEHFMNGYYLVIMEIRRLNEMILQLFQELILYAEDPGAPVPLNKRFQVRKGFIEPTHASVFQRYPFALFEVFLLLAQHPELHGVSATTIRLIRNHRHLVDDRFRLDLRNRSLFMEILRQPQGITHQLRAMHRYGLLAAYIPAFGKVVGLMQYDLFHVYTVDEHTLMVLRNVRRLTVPDFAHEHPFCSQLITKVPKLEILYLAALFHDIAKGRGGDHSRLGAEESLEFCLLHGMSQYDARLVSWLVRHHLSMSRTAQRQDTSDPVVIRDFADLVRDQNRLNYLYLLTVSDIKGTSPQLWNNWKDALLLGLYQATTRELRRGVENPGDRGSRITETQQQAREILEEVGISTAIVNEIWARFDDDYFLRHTGDEIAWHTEGIAVCTTSCPPLVLIRHETSRGATAIFLFAHDRDYLFATVTRAIDELALNIVDARIITTEKGLVLDTFFVLDSNGQPLSDSYQIDEIRAKLHSALKNPSKQAVLENRPIPRRLKHFSIPTEIAFSTDLRHHFTIVEVTASDRPGFLSLVGQALAECDVRLHSAKIATFGERVEDVFFVTDRQRKPLVDMAQFDCLQRNLQARLGHLA